MVALSMSRFFRTTGLKINPEIAPGVCPHCEETSTFISVFKDRYRCMNCGCDVEQKINGAIRYLPLGGDVRLEHGPKEN